MDSWSDNFWTRVETGSNLGRYSLKYAKIIRIFSIKYYKAKMTSNKHLLHRSNIIITILQFAVSLLPKSSYTPWSPCLRLNGKIYFNSCFQTLTCVSFNCQSVQNHLNKFTWQRHQTVTILPFFSTFKKNKDLSVHSSLKISQLIRYI